MKPKPPSWRPFGQASLSSSLLSKSRQVGEEIQKKSGKKAISLSEFLDRKIGKTSRKSIQEKQRCFASIGTVVDKDSKAKNDVAGDGFVLDKAVFRLFKHSEKEVVGERAANFQPESTKGEQDLGKRKTPFGALSGDDERTSSPKYMVVLGDDPKPKKLSRGEERFEDHREKPIYNYYANGSGGWDGEREGIDTEEVGSSEVWEGMGSTTLGGLEWH
ncbi:hypothetical protein J5N97_024465 [Dioscorea zingiberensis]|uniref:Uncharacterized protein n=1 Tax=Dioscorea zingiberensis TaxID=325984 RepID=A0A9D5H930_9LILI|nr:hypothetical protein J5N97_024465 [Dioscorea zingiberensis]